MVGVTTTFVRLYKQLAVNGRCLSPVTSRRPQPSKNGCALDGWGRSGRGSGCYPMGGVYAANPQPIRSMGALTPTLPFAMGRSSVDADGVMKVDNCGSFGMSVGLGLDKDIVGGVGYR